MQLGTITFVTFIGILVFQLAKVTGISQYLKKKCAAVAVTNVHQAEAEVEPADINFLPDRLVNPGQYEPPLYTLSQWHNTVFVWCLCTLKLFNEYILQLYQIHPIFHNIPLPG